MGFWLILLLFVGTTVLSALLQKKPKDAVASSKGDFQVPTAEEGRAIPVVHGTCLLKGPNVVWWGDLRADPIKKKSGGFLGLGAKKVTTGYRYSASIIMALCHGTVDAVIDILIGDKSLSANATYQYNFLGIHITVPGVSPALPQNAVSGGQVFAINLPDLFGGEDQEGGLQGGVGFFFGDSAQNACSQATSGWGANAPAWRGLCYMGWTGYLGTSPYIKNWSAIVRKCTTPLGLDSSKANINGDANPAYIIADIMSSTVYGLGSPAGRFDLTTFQAVANTLYTEGFGMSVLLDSGASADAVIADILRTIDAVLYTDPATGLWTLRLARADYDPASLLEITQDDILEAPEFSRGSWSETLNEVKIAYLDRSQNFQERIVQAQETANYAIRGELASDTFTFHGVTNATQATKLAMRELKTHSYPLAQLKLKVNRKAWALRPGAPFKLTWQPPTGPGFVGMVLRVTEIRYGDLSAGEIEVQAVEDIFAVAATAYTDTGGTGWTDPSVAPANALAVMGQEAPYWLTGETRFVMAAVVRGDATSYAAAIWTNQSGGYIQSADLTSLTPSGVLLGAYSVKTAANDTVGFTVASGGVDLDRLVAESTDSNGLTRGDNLLIIDSEWMSWKTAVKNGDGSFTFSGILRGVLDTVPADHSSGARVWFISDGSCTTRELAFTADLTEQFKATPRNSKGEASIASASTVSVTTASRAWAPYPPGNVKINTLGLVSWPTTTLDDAAFTWSHRNRVTEGVGGAMVAQDTAGSYTQEGTYTLEVLVGGTVKQTLTGQTGTSYTYTAAQRIIDDTDGNKAVQLRITPINGSYTGTQRTTPGVVMTGFGMGFGTYFGGIQG